MERHSPSEHRPKSRPWATMLRAKKVAEILDLPLATLYEHARNHPGLLGVVRIGRSIRFRPDAIEKLVCGSSDRTDPKMRRPALSRAGGTSQKEQN